MRRKSKTAIRFTMYRISGVCSRTICSFRSEPESRCTCPSLRLQQSFPLRCRLLRATLQRFVSRSAPLRRPSCHLQRLGEQSAYAKCGHRNDRGPGRGGCGLPSRARCQRRSRIGAGTRASFCERMSMGNQKRAAPRSFAVIEVPPRAAAAAHSTGSARQRTVAICGRRSYETVAQSAGAHRVGRTRRQEFGCGQARARNSGSGAIDRSALARFDTAKFMRAGRVNSKSTRRLSRATCRDLRLAGVQDRFLRIFSTRVVRLQAEQLRRADSCSSVVRSRA